jgi:hypothetical protein
MARNLMLFLAEQKFANFLQNNIKFLDEEHFCENSKIGSAFIVQFVAKKSYCKNTFIFKLLQGLVIIISTFPCR